MNMYIGVDFGPCQVYACVTVYKSITSSSFDELSNLQFDLFNPNYVTTLNAKLNHELRRASMQSDY